MMIIRSNLKAMLIIMVLAFIMPAIQADAGIFDDIKLWYNQKSEINKHSRVISSEVKTLYRERKSIQRFSEGASGLIRAYRAIRNKGSKASLPQMLDIAKSISLVVSEFKNLAPKAEAMYRNAQPSMKYFSQLADQTETIQTNKNKILVKSFSDGRLNKLAGANGWSRVFDSVKSDPLNLFRWGRLQDEYKLGKVEAQYPLKCAQIAFEASAYYFAARDSVQELLGIQKEIEGILGGDLGAILNVAGTVNKIQNSGQSIEALGELAETGALRIGKRFDELLKVQEDYVAINKSYNDKYNKTPSASGSSGSTTVSASGTTARQSTTSAAPSTGNNSGSAAVSLERAMANYQKAYQAYVEISQRGNASQNEVNKAINELNAAKRQVEQAKAR
ncbi:MAG TPA: hypothetical protein PLK58_01220 [Candidatus Rifleibacterium sp.]|nr:hypothetical protein [Candidatus Rifleibacterium sp.]HPW57232.1 hypothetical protein [Candidatus Rifleibacterium sp.]